MLFPQLYSTCLSNLAFLIAAEINDLLAMQHFAESIVTIREVKLNVLELYVSALYDKVPKLLRNKIYKKY